MNWEIGIGMCAVPCAKQIASGKLLYSTGGSALCCLLKEKGVGYREVWVNEIDTKSESEQRTGSHLLCDFTDSVA